VIPVIAQKTIKMVKKCNTPDCTGIPPPGRRVLCDDCTPKPKVCKNDGCTNVPSERREICDECEPLGTCKCGNTLPNRQKTTCDTCANVVKLLDIVQTSVRIIVLSRQKINHVKKYSVMNQGLENAGIVKSVNQFILNTNKPLGSIIVNGMIVNLVLIDLMIVAVVSVKN
jgi:hypothetical protein